MTPPVEDSRWGEVGGHRTIAHDGIWKGFLSDMLLAPDDGIGVPAFSNTGAFNTRGAPVTARHIGLMPMSFQKRPDVQNPRPWVNGAIAAPSRRSLSAGVAPPGD